MTKPNINYLETIIKGLITSLVTAVVVGAVARFTLINTMNDQLIKIQLRLDNLESRYVELNQFIPVKEQTIENKNRINEIQAKLQRHEVAIELLGNK